MQEYSNSLIFMVVVVAFVAGYSVVSCIVRRWKEIQNRPRVPDEKRQGQTKADNERPRQQENYCCRQTEEPQWPEQDDGEQKRRQRTKQDRRRAEEYSQRAFTVPKPDLVYVGDITSLPTRYYP